MRGIERAEGVGEPRPGPRVGDDSEPRVLKSDPELAEGERVRFLSRTQNGIPPLAGFHFVSEKRGGGATRAEADSSRMVKLRKNPAYSTMVVCHSGNT